MLLSMFSLAVNVAVIGFLDVLLPVLPRIAVALEVKVLPLRAETVKVTGSVLLVIPVFATVTPLVVFIPYFWLLLANPTLMIFVNY